MPYNTQAEIKSLLELSARIGGDPLLTQASTGNTSIKLDGTLWIKGSGKWLAAARNEDILVPVDLDSVDSAYPPGASIETAMHAVIPHRVVAHVHSVNTIAWAVRDDARSQLTCLLAGLNWRWIPYVPSGRPLARAVEQELAAAPDADVFVLGNHGLVVAGETCHAVETLLDEVERRLAIPPRLAPEPDYGLLIELSGASAWNLPDEPELHALATDEISRGILGGGILYPCQAIFLNSPGAAVFQPVPLGDCRCKDRPFLLVEDAGTLLARSLMACEYAMLRGLAEVVQRIGPDAPIRYLTPTEIDSGFNLDAYRYRELASGIHR